MIEASQPFKQIVSLVEPQAKLIRHWQLNGGISCTMTGIEIEHIDSSRQTLVVREVGNGSFENYPESVRNEYELLRYLSECGIPVATPKHFDLSCNILDRPYLVLDYVEGSPDLVTDDRTKRVTNMADHLAKVHSVDIRHSAMEFMKPSPLRIRPANEPLNEALQETKIRTALELNFSTVSENPYTFRHGDFWPGNLIWHSGDLAAIIDWEETSIGDPLFDVAIARLDILWAYGVEAMNTFTAVYQARMDLDYTYLPYWDLRVSLRPISNIVEWSTSFPQLDRPDVTAETMSDGHRWFVDKALNLLGEA